MTSEAASSKRPEASWNTAVASVEQALAATVVARDEAGGTAKHERDLLRASGLLALSTPVVHGGLGATWYEVLDVVRRFARVDSSVAHLFAFHRLLLATTRLFGKASQWQPWLEQSAQRQWFWGNALTAAERGTLAIAVAAAKVATTRASLEIARRMFEVTGARATTAALRLDRYWRNLRVHTLHDPVDYKVRKLGDWVLNDRYPVPSFYA